MVCDEAENCCAVGCAAVKPRIVVAWVVLKPRGGMICCELKPRNEVRWAEAEN